MINFLKVEKGNIWRFTFTLSEDGCLSIYYPGSGEDIEDKQILLKEEAKALFRFLLENQDRIST